MTVQLPSDSTHECGGHEYCVLLARHLYQCNRCHHQTSVIAGTLFEVSKLPYAVLIDASGSIRAKGLVNTREHVESLFEADRLGVASLQEYLEAEPTGPAAEPRAKGAA